MDVCSWGKATFFYVFFAQKRSENTIKCKKVRYINVYRRIATVFVLTFLAFSKAWCQYDVAFSHYFVMEPSFNPAAVGKEAKINVTGAYNMSMVGFRHNPNTMYIAGDVPFYALKTYHGVGANILSDNIGAFTHQRIAVQYAYKKQLFGGMLSAGIQVGFLSEKLDGSKLDFEDTGDPALASSEVDGSSLDLCGGLYYLHKRWYVGASVLHLTAPTVELGQTNELKIDRSYFLTAGYHIKLRNQNLSIPVSVLLRSDLVGYRGDLTGRLLYRHENRNMYAGVTYSPKNSVTVLIGGSFHGINVGYSYEAYTQGIGLENGAHELFVGYQQDVNLFKKGRNKHKSVRIL